MDALHLSLAASWLLVMSHGLFELDLDAEDNCATQLLQTSVRNPRTFPEYYWVQRGGKPTNFGSTEYTAPSDLSKKPAWTWQNEFDEEVRHSPLIDHMKNIYVMTTLKLRKFDSDGNLLWMWHPEEGKMTASPALYQGGVYLLSVVDSKSNPYVIVHSVDMETGQTLWTRTIQGSAGGDSQSVTVYNGTCIIPLMESTAGTNKFAAVSASNGSFLWDYTMDEVVWNAAPTTPGDSTLLFAGSCGGAFRIAFGGKLIWRAGAKAVPRNMCSTGGGALGPNGVFYTEYTKFDGSAQVSAYQVSDGTLLWERNFPKYGGGQYPAVGRLGKDGLLVVAVAIGDNPGIPIPLIPLHMIPGAIDKYLKDPETRKKMGVPNNVAAVVVMDANTGDVVWRWEEKLWDHFAAAGDEEPATFKRFVTGGPFAAVCMPDLAGIPLIAGDGTIYFSSSHAGDLTAIRDDNHNGIIEPNEVSVFPTGKCFLNSPSLAPGMLVAAPCWGPMYVFKE